MNKSRVIVLGIAFVAAVGAALVAKNLVAPKKVVKKEFMNTTQVLVAAKKIKLGDMVTSSHFKWQRWPKSALNSSLIDKGQNKNALADYDKAIARAGFVSGEAINPRKFIKKGRGGVMAAILSSGMRAVSLKIKASTAAGGFIMPDDHVDVLLSRKLKRRNGGKFVTSTVLSRVRVLAIGKTIDAPKGKKTTKGRTATLELTPAQAETLILAGKMGSITLALRPLAENSGDADEVANLRGEKRKTIRMFKFGKKIEKFGL